MVDMTCELPRMITSHVYSNVPSWDGTAVTPDQWQKSVRWVLQKRRELDLPVLVHCAFGRGRSVCFLSSLLVSQRNSLSLLNSLF